ncbi:transcriptional regulator with XRE-family HTH domain [Streptomyces griseochromogenes]|uniref:Transcriptional regulator with XRE-family HTH domain n=1 Tax=Streptomyces griseochromogenes TaxID=68214 RepID=A0ABS4LWM9_9ACTN|nr:transcriptional regulator with XRE-family HTH domain [Streptomyces griseochromogenes]
MRIQPSDPVDVRIGARLAELRARHGWSLGEPAERNGAGRSTLSRAERAEISATAALLNRLRNVYGRTMSQLLSEVEAEPALAPTSPTTARPCQDWNSTRGPSTARWR